MAEHVVQLHFGRFVHPLYRAQLAAIPEGWRYVSSHPALRDAAAPTKRILERGKRFGRARETAEGLALRSLSAAGYVHRVGVRAWPGAALIHSGERLLRNSPLPYVLDFEHAELFVLYQRAALDRPWATWRLRHALLDDRLAFLLPWSEAARASLLASLPPDVGRRLAPKLRVVTPAIGLEAPAPSSRSDGPLRMLFIGTLFYEKGAVEAVQALRAVRESHDVTLDMITYPPEEWRPRLEAEPGLTVHAPGGTDLVQRLYRAADVLLFPSHIDTFGWAVVEAMARGLPVIAPRHLALTETVQDGVSGLLFQPENMSLRADDAVCRFRHMLPPPSEYLAALGQPSPDYVRRVAACIAHLAEDRSLYAQLADGAFRAVESGRLSLKTRRQALADIYDRAI